MKRSRKIIFIIFCILAVCLTGLSDWAVDAGLKRDGWGSEVRESAQKKTDEEAEDPDNPMYRVRLFRRSIAAETEAFQKSIPEEEITICSEDGLKLAGYLRKNGDSHVYVLCFHGYRADHHEITSLGFAKRFYDMGFNVLCPDQRAHGNSEGKWIGMGWLERKDVVSWAEYVTSMDHQAEIILFGESMGASSILAAAGEQLPASVKCLISDSAYAGTSRIASEAMWNQAHIPSFPLLYTADIFCYFKAGYMLKRNDIRNALKKCTVPVLLFHGSLDEVVNVRNMQLLYDAIPSDRKEEVLVEDAGHVCSSQLEPQLYWSHVNSFLEKYMK